MASDARTPPNYRPQDINPNTGYLEAKALLSPPVVNFVIDAFLGADASYDFGEIEADTDKSFGIQWMTTAFTNAEANFFKGAVAVYTGDEGAFNLYGRPVVEGGDGAVILPLTPSFLGAFQSTLTALAADDGVEKTGTFTLYYSIVDGTFANQIGTLTLTKTYVAP